MMTCNGNEILDPDRFLPISFSFSVVRDATAEGGQKERKRKKFIFIPARQKYSSEREGRKEEYESGELSLPPSLSLSLARSVSDMSVAPL